MILYLDTSALIKLYVDEEGAADVHRAVEDSAGVATCVIAYAEARAALARRHRELAFASEAFRLVLAALDRDWRSFTRVEVNDALARLAGVLAEQKALRGFDAVHLASALALQARLGEVTFMAFDQRLVEAADGLLPVRP